MIGAPIRKRAKPLPKLERGERFGRQPTRVTWPDVEARATLIVGDRVLPNLVLLETRRGHAKRITIGGAIMSVKVAYKNGVFEPLQKVEGAKPGKVYTTFFSLPAKFRSNFVTANPKRSTIAQNESPGGGDPHRFAAPMAGPSR